MGNDASLPRHFQCEQSNVHTARIVDNLAKLRFKITQGSRDHGLAFGGDFDVVVVHGKNSITELSKGQVFFAGRDGDHVMLWLFDEKIAQPFEHGLFSMEESRHDITYC